MKRSHLIYTLSAAILVGTENELAFAQDSPAPVCDVLQTLLRAQGQQPVLPSGSGEVHYVLEYLTSSVPRGGQLSITEAERKDLAVRAASHDYAPFEPKCDWTAPIPRVPPFPFFQTYYAFTNPLFSSDGKLAIVAFSRIVKSGVGGSGFLCAVRKNGDSWEANCTGTWIS
jgi:hypothetical protein